MERKEYTAPTLHDLQHDKSRDQTFESILLEHERSGKIVKLHHKPEGFDSIEAFAEDRRMALTLMQEFGIDEFLPKTELMLAGDKLAIIQEKVVGSHLGDFFDDMRKSIHRETDSLGLKLLDGTRELAYADFLKAHDELVYRCLRMWEATVHSTNRQLPQGIHFTEQTWIPVQPGIGLMPEVTNVKNIMFSGSDPKGQGKVYLVDTGLVAISKGDMLDPRGAIRSGAVSNLFPMRTSANSGELRMLRSFFKNMERVLTRQEIKLRIDAMVPIRASRLFETMTNREGFGAMRGEVWNVFDEYYDTLP